MGIYVVRHGETKLNEEGRLQGRNGEPLNEKGIKPESLSSTDGAERPATLDFATAVGEGSLTRFDKKKNKNKKNKKHRPQK